MTWLSGEPVVVTFRVAAGDWLIIERLGLKTERARHGKVGGPGTSRCLMLLVDGNKPALKSRNAVRMAIDVHFF